MIRALPVPRAPQHLHWPSVIPWLALAVLVYAIVTTTHGGDARAYYDARLAEPYGNALVGERGFLYSPAFLLLVTPFQALPWPIFHALMVASGMLALTYLIGPWWATLAVLMQAPFIWNDLLWGNIYLVTAAVIVMAMHRPALWAWPLLTKVTPGVGIAWHAGRRDWQSVLRASVVTAAIALGAALMAPLAWLDWFNTLQSSAGSVRMIVPPLARIGVGVALAAWAGHSERVWVVPIACAIAAPEPATATVYLLGIPRLLTHHYRVSELSE